ncbi:hypothetical protein REPUB_Repub03eG0179800 [Reevesia pubescens]
MFSAQGSSRNHCSLLTILCGGKVSDNKQMQPISDDKPKYPFQELAFLGRLERTRIESYGDDALCLLIVFRNFSGFADIIVYFRYTSLLAVGISIMLFLLTRFSDPGTVKAENVSQYLFVYPYDNIIYTEKECSPYLLDPSTAAVLKFSQHTGAHAIAGRHTLGTFINQLQTFFSEPRLLILTDPRTGHQPIKEATLGNFPTIAFCDTDSPMGYVDIGILANNKGKHSIGCLFWLLGRIVLQMRGIIVSGKKWNVTVDLFFYREPEKAKQQEDEETVVALDYGLPAVDYGMGALGTDQWPSQLGDQWPTDVVQAPIAGVPTVSWRVN